MGTNDIQRGIFAEEIMGDTLDLVDTIKSQSPTTKIVISGILHRRDINDRRINRINEELDWLCSVRNCLMLHGNSWIGSMDLASDGVHLNRRGADKLGQLLVNAVNSCLGN